MAEQGSDEREVMQLLGEAAARFSKLPVEHEADMDDFVHAIHAAQNIILARVGLRAQREAGVTARARERAGDGRTEAVGFASALGDDDE